MVDVTPLVRKGQQIIQSYSGGVFKVNGKTYEHALIVTPENTWQWAVSDIVDVTTLELVHFDELIEQANEIDVVLLGCGSTMAFLPPKLRVELKAAGLSVDIMGTGAACRTYNVLMAEGRRVACALLQA